MNDTCKRILEHFIFQFFFEEFIAHFHFLFFIYCVIKLTLIFQMKYPVYYNIFRSLICEFLFMIHSHNYLYQFSINELFSTTFDQNIAPFEFSYYDTAGPKKLKFSSWFTEIQCIISQNGNLFNIVQGC